MIVREVSANVPTSGLKLMQIWETLQFLNWPLVTGSKSELFSIDSHVKISNFGPGDSADAGNQCAHIVVTSHNDNIVPCTLATNGKCKHNNI